MKGKLLCLVFFFFLMLPHAFGAFPGDTARFKNQRRQMVADQIESRGVSAPAVLAAMREIPRHLFVPPLLRAQAYADHPLPIGEGQTISQPYIVALMTEALSLTKDQKVLEIGTGSGYQAAILSQVAESVVTMEIKKKLHFKAAQTLKSLKFDNVTPIFGDGYFGWPEGAPYDAIMITAAVEHIPPPLLQQLKDGGKMILPQGNPFSFQQLILVTKKGSDYSVKHILGVLFVPMTGEALKQR